MSYIQSEYVFPFPPSVNTLYFQGPKHGQKFLSKKGKEYKSTIRELYLDDDRKPMSGYLEVYIDLLLPDLRKRDIDNYEKAVLDSLVEINAIEDDSQVKKITVIDRGKCSDISKGVAIISINQISYNEITDQYYSSRFIAHICKVIGCDNIKDVKTNVNKKKPNEPVFHKPKKVYIKKKDLLKSDDEA